MEHCRPWETYAVTELSYQSNSIELTRLLWKHLYLVFKLAQ